MKKYLYDRLSNGSFKPKIARTFPSDQTIEAYRYLESNEQIVFCHAGACSQALQTD